MNYRIEISPLPQWHDARGEGVKKQVGDFLGIALERVRTRDVYTVSAAISADEAAKLADLLGHSSIETTRIYLLSTGEEHAKLLDTLHLVL